MNKKINSATRLAKSIVAKHIKMLKEDNDFDDTQSVASSTKSINKGLSDYHAFLREEVIKIKQELNDEKIKKTPMEIRKMAIERWKANKK